MKEEEKRARDRKDSDLLIPLKSLNTKALALNKRALPKGKDSLTLWNQYFV